MKTNSLRSVVCCTSLLFVGSAYAQPLLIDVLDAQYSTGLYLNIANTNGPDPVIESRTTVSNEPIYDSIAIGPLAPPPYSHQGLAEAMSSLFGVYAYALAINGHGSAWATNQFRFSPSQDSIQTALDVQISLTGLRFSVGSASLSDLTANSQLWEYDWAGRDFGPLGFHTNTDFVASHQYEVTMWIHSGAQDDASGGTMQLNGLEVVPEPSTTLLLATFSGALLIYRRRRQ